MKEILAINPNIKLLATPWSPPAWMKTNDGASGGSLLPQYYAVYAQYFVKYILAMQAKGITYFSGDAAERAIECEQQSGMCDVRIRRRIFLCGSIWGRRFRRPD